MLFIFKTVFLEGISLNFAFKVSVSLTYFRPNLLKMEGELAPSQW